MQYLEFVIVFINEITTSQAVRMMPLLLSGIGVEVLFSHIAVERAPE